MGLGGHTRGSIPGMEEGGGSTEGGEVAYKLPAIMGFVHLQSPPLSCQAAWI